MQTQTDLLNRQCELLKNKLSRYYTIFEVFFAYSKHEVLDAIYKLDQEDKDFLLLYHPLNGVGSSGAQLAKHYHIAQDTITVYINSLYQELHKCLQDHSYKPKKCTFIVKRMKTIFDYYSYPKEKVIKALNRLYYEDRKLLLLHYPMEQSGIGTCALGNLYQLSENRMGNCIKRIKDELTHVLEDETYEPKMIMAGLLNFFEEYPKDKIINALNGLYKGDRKFILTFFPLSCKPYFLISPYMKKNTLKICNKIIKELSLILKGQQYFESNFHTEKITFNYLTEVYSQNDIINAFSLLKDEQKELLLHVIEGKAVKDLALEYDCSQQCISQKIGNIRKKVLKHLEGITIFKERNSFFPYLNTQVLYSLFQLDEFKTDLFFLYYPFEGKSNTLNDISKQVNLSIPQISKILKATYEGVIEILKQYNPVEVRDNLYPYLRLLSERERQVIMLAYFDRKHYDVDEIAKKLLLDEHEVIKIIYDALNHVRELQKYSDSDKRRQYYKKIQS